jgi:UDP-N-acetyl-D-mannosaminuronate dehydrogenase
MPVMELSPSELKMGLRTGRITVAVYGIGHVGASILAAWLLAGARGIGVDKDEGKVGALNKGESPVNEPCLSEIFGKAKLEGRLYATSDGKEASAKSDVKIIAVPSMMADGKPDLSAISSVAESIASALREEILSFWRAVSPRGRLDIYSNRYWRRKADFP